MIHADLRIIAATNKDLAREVAADRFRSDLYYRLKVVTISIPPLRERREDIPALLEYFVRKHSARPVTFTPAATEAIASRPWPGNVRELENTVRRLILLGRGGTIDVNDLSFGEDSEIAEEESHSPEPADTPPDLTEALDRLWQTLQRCRDQIEPGKTYLWLEQELAKRALEDSGGNQVQAAKLLGVSRNTLRQRLGLSRSSSPEK